MVMKAWSWKSSNIACRRVYKAFLENQFPVSVDFESAGKLTLGQLSYYVRGSGTVAERAESLAFWLGHYWTKIRNDSFEPGVSPSQALKAMVSSLKKAGDTIADFAQVVDEQFKFRKES